MTLQQNPNEIKITRLYNASVKAVWDAWTDPEQVAQWWGPRGFTITTHSKDFRPGGSWVYTMHGPDGVEYPNKTPYLEIETYKRLVYDHGGNDDRPPLFRVTVLFSEIDGQTKMDMTMTLPTPEALEQAKKIIKDAGGNTTWDRLAEFLEKRATSKEIFVINRTFDAPLNTMFDMWTNPQHVAAWSGPKGSQMEFIRADIREGGGSFYKMQSNGELQPMYGKVQYLRICHPNLIVYTQQFCDENENITRHPLAATWPETMLTTVILSEETPQQTRVTLTWEIYNEATQEELDTFANAKPGMTQGWTGSFDRLEDYLSEIHIQV